ncbi:glycosyl transferase [Bacillus sp. Soil745]|nr:glycosyl transferase [Bacillus sp. Soil745]
MSKSILMIGPSSSNKGGISSVIKSYEESEKLAENIHFISSYKDGNKMIKIIAAFIGYIKFIMALLINNSIKGVHIHTASRGSFNRKRIFVYISKIFRKKVILHVHGAEFMTFYKESSKENQKKISKTLNKADLIIALSERWKKDLGSICNNENIRVIYNPINRSLYKTSPLKEKNIIFLGRIGRRKGVYDLLESLQLVLDQTKDFKVYIAGDGNIEKAKKVIVDLNLEKHVEVIGWINLNKKIELLYNSSIFVLPSYNEGLPVSILEAMASGVPVISTNIAGIPDQIVNGVNGFLIEPGNINDLAKKICLLLNDRKLRDEFSKKTLKRVDEKFNINIIEKCILDAYKQLGIVSK